MIPFLYSNGSQSVLYTEIDFDHLCDQLLRGSAQEATAALHRILSVGMSAYDLYLRVLPQMTQRLGKLWDEDLVSSSSVQLATLRIEAFLEDVRPPEPIQITRQTKQALLASVPGDKHTIGIKVAADILRSKGWDIDLKKRASYTQLMVDIDHAPASVLALSVGSAGSMDALDKITHMVGLLRPDMKILICGPLVKIEPNLFTTLKVHGVSAKFDEAEALLDSLIEVSSVSSPSE